MKGLEKLILAGIGVGIIVVKAEEIEGCFRSLCAWVEGFKKA